MFAALSYQHAAMVPRIPKKGASSGMITALALDARKESCKEAVIEAPLAGKLGRRRRATSKEGTSGFMMDIYKQPDINTLCMCPAGEEVTTRKNKKKRLFHEYEIYKYRIHA